MGCGGTRSGGEAWAGEPARSARGFATGPFNAERDCRRASVGSEVE